MHNELTKMDIQKMREELDYRRVTLRPQLLEEVKVARSFGDLSENFEYKAAKREKNKNESRIRYLENMIKTARVIEDRSAPDTVGLYDKVCLLYTSFFSSSSTTPPFRLWIVVVVPAKSPVGSEMATPVWASP